MALEAKARSVVNADLPILERFATAPSPATRTFALAFALHEEGR